MVSVATWNVNSIKSRLEHLSQWLKDASPDIVCLQETKTIDDAFPFVEIEELSYNVVIHGQKTYNGVAILSKFPIDDVIKGLPGDETDEQARYIEAVISLPDKALRVASVYVPNGSEVGSEKFAYKMAFFDRLKHHMQSLLSYREICVIGGDYNVAPKDMDVYDTVSLAGSVCFHPDEQAKFRNLEHLGYYDAYRTMHPKKQEFSWWDYRGGSWQAGKGLRIDHLLLSPQAIDKLKNCVIDMAPRGKEKPSDHTPVICYLDA
jgi:exodeoxyribonuclease-3